MKKRIVLLTTLAAVLVAAMALSGVAQAAPIGGKADAQCAKVAIKTLGPSVNPSNYTFIGGTEGNDGFTELATDNPQVFCGFGGDDDTQNLAGDDIFLGGAGTDGVGLKEGTFYGEAGNDLVGINRGTFFGGAGDDHVNTDQ